MTGRPPDENEPDEKRPCPIPVEDFLDPRTTPFMALQSRGDLPHLYKPCSSYFVTFRLWDAVIPAKQRRHWAELHRRIEQPEMSRDRDLAIEIGMAAEPALRRGSCLLSREGLARTVQDALRHFDGERYQLAAWCIMPNHVHVAYTVLGAHSPEGIHHSWKSYTANRLNRLLSRRGTVWERESFDHVIRSVEHYEAFVYYIEQNPVAAGLCERPDQWPWSSAASPGG